MSAKTGTTSRASAQREGVAPIRTAALAAVLLSSTLSFSNVFHSGWIEPVWGTILGGLIVAALLRFFRVGPVLALLIPVIIFLLCAGWISAPRTLVAGVIPSTATVGTLLAQVHAAHTVIASHVPPITPTAGVLLAVCATVGSTTLIADAATFRSGVPMAALGYALVLAAPASIIRPGHSVLHAVALLVSMGAFLLTESSIETAPVSGTGRQPHTVLHLRAVTVALAAIIALVATPALGLPRQGSLATVPFHAAFQGAFGATGAVVHINPVVSLRRDLLASPTVPLFSVTAPHATYWRLLTLDTFNGTTWTATTGGHALTLEQAARTQVPAFVATRAFVQTVHVLSLGGGLLPTATTPVTILGAGPTTVNSATLGVRDASPLGGSTYTVRSVVAAPSPLRLDAALPVDHRRFASELQLPRVGGRVYLLARSITKTSTSAYERALAIEGYLRNTHRFTYSLAAAPSAGNALDQFLFVTRTGYCQQFAGAMAVLARAVGIPARVAVGFTPGTFTAGHWLVTTADAHSWPELYFPGSGWVRFEPTPGTAGNTGPAGLASPTNPAVAPKAAATTPPQAALSMRRPSAGAQSRLPSTTTRGSTPSRPSTLGRTTGLSPLAASVAIGLTGLTVTAVLLEISVLRPRRRHGRRSRSPRDDIIAAYAALSDWEHAAGVGRRPSETMRAHARRVSLIHPASAAALSSGVALCEQAVYGTSVLNARDARDAWRAVLEIQQRVEAQHTRRWRIQVRLRLLARSFHPGWARKTAAS